MIGCKALCQHLKFTTPPPPRPRCAVASNHLDKARNTEASISLLVDVTESEPNKRSTTIVGSSNRPTVSSMHARKGIARSPTIQLPCLLCDLESLLLETRRCRCLLLLERCRSLSHVFRYEQEH
ncbi:hypothetical protein Rs2_21944 [Raphanus sativus]|nr:hypothetical protein Rs2_21944 [Raphanus sativus]